MIIDMNYWSKVFRRVLVFALTILGVYLAFKLVMFYIPFLIAFIISLLIEPLIRLVKKKTKLNRKVSAIIVMLIVFSIIIGLLVWGITSLITEASDLLQGLNGYFDTAYEQIQGIINGFDLEAIELPNEVKNIIQNSLSDFLGTVSEWIKNALSSILNGITSVPTIGIYTVITILSTYFICTDKIYILDQIEHHFPKTWVKKLSIHIREITKTLGKYLKAEAILIFISFIISLIGLYIFHFAKMNVPYPLIMAIAIAFVDALPILGSGTIMLPWAVICAINGDISLAIAILVLWAIMSIVRQFIEPRIVGKQIGIHPIFTLIAMYTGYKFIGVIGMLVGPIVLIILKNIFGTLIDKGVVKTILDRR